jgi:Probable zinc-ribbon domain
MPIKQYSTTGVSKIPVNRNQWSESSQRSNKLIEFYEESPWHCRGCGHTFVFTAEEQQHAFEVEQRYIHWHPVLCADCAQKKESIGETIRQYEARWRVNKKTLRRDPSFLKNWTVLLEAYAHLTGRKNRTVLQMLQQLTQPKA